MLSVIETPVFQSMVEAISFGRHQSAKISRFSSVSIR
jgi:hypothetical protein